MAKGKLLGLPRVSNSGPLSYEDEQAPGIPEDFEVPKITDHEGNEDYWNSWDSNIADVPADLIGVTGLYYPELNWVVVDNRIGIHHIVQEKSSKKDNTIPNVEEHTVVPFAQDYIDPDTMENIVGLQGMPDVIDDIHIWESDVSLPEEGSMLYNEPSEQTLTKDHLTHQGLYSIVYTLFTLDIEEQSIAHILLRPEGDILTQRINNVLMGDMYEKIPLAGIDKVPDKKIDRDNNIRAD